MRNRQIAIDGLNGAAQHWCKSRNAQRGAELVGHPAEIRLLNIGQKKLRRWTLAQRVVVSVRADAHDPRQVGLIAVSPKHPPDWIYIWKTLLRQRLIDHRHLWRSCSIL